MKRIRISITVSVLLFMFVLKAGIALSSDDDWVTSSGNTYITSGNVGIGTANPQGQLHLYQTNGGGNIILSEGARDGKINVNGVGNAGHIIFSVDNSSGNMTERMRIDGSTGSIGIGTTSPGVGIRLDVVGKVRAHEIIVNLDNPADFVFEENYNLRTINEVESYIKENKHLPDIPSGKEVKENGVGVAEMIAKQMQKIEELTLYVIEQNKEIQGLKKKLAELEE